MTHQRAGRVVTANGEGSIWNPVEIIISSTLSPITKHPDGAFTVKLPWCGVETVLDSLTVVDSCGTGVGESAVERTLFHVALRA